MTRAHMHARTPTHTYAPDALLDRVALVVLQVGVEFLQLQGRLLRGRLDPERVHRRNVHHDSRDRVRQDRLAAGQHRQGNGSQGEGET